MRPQKKEIEKKKSRNFYDFLTLLTSTEKLLTRVEFELARSETPVSRSTSSAIELSPVELSRYHAPVGRYRVMTS